MTTNDHSPPTDALHLILAASALDHAAKTTAAWAGAGDAEIAAAMFSGLAEGLQIELADPTWSTQPATLEAVSLISRAYAAAADAVRRTDTAPELGHGEIKQRGCTYAADWLQSQADMFALFGVQLGEQLPPEHQGQVRFKPADADGHPAVEFATLVVVHDDQIDVTVHPDQPHAIAYSREHFPDSAPPDHRVDVHTMGVVDDLHDPEWLHKNPEVELATLVVVRDGHIEVTIHPSDTAAGHDFHDRFPAADPTLVRGRIDLHRPKIAGPDRTSQG